MHIPTYIFAALAMFAMMGIVAWSSRRRSKRLDPRIREARASEQKEDKS